MDRMKCLFQQLGKIIFIPTRAGARSDAHSNCGPRRIKLQPWHEASVGTPCSKSLTTNSHRCCTFHRKGTTAATTFPRQHQGSCICSPDKKERPQSLYGRSFEEASNTLQILPLSFIMTRAFFALQKIFSKILEKHLFFTGFYCDAVRNGS